MTRKKIAVVGGGATGGALLWSLTRNQAQRDGYEATLFHDEPSIGGHSDTYFVKFDGAGKGTLVPDMTPGSFAIDIGVQFVCPPVYPNLYEMLKLPEFVNQNKMRLKNHPKLRIASGFKDDLNWGNFPEYQSGPRFDKCYTPKAVEAAELFQEDLRFFDLGWWMSWDIDRYLKHKDFDRQGNFFRYMLVSYLTIINGYGTDELLSMTKRDLFPIFAKIPFFQNVGPLGSFTQPGTGWDRFEYGAQRWVEGMVDFAKNKGSDVKINAHVKRVVPKAQGDLVCVEWVDAALKNDPNAPVHTALFDEVVLTTDMDVNKKLLGHNKNPFWSVQDDYVAAWNLMPGLCVIHQDTEVLAPSLRDQKEDAHFNAYYTWDNNTGGNLFNLPYNLANTFTTYLMQNIVGCPAPCYVSMYAVADHAKRPDPSKVIFEKTWKHGRWVSTHDMKNKQKLHEIQGLGHVWYAGNNCTVDSEEGALIAAIALAKRLFKFENPMDDFLSKQTFGFFEDIMFPKKSLAEHLSHDKP
jgi:NAD(P)-binding Rossmann-like domain